MEKEIKKSLLTPEEITLLVDKINALYIMTRTKHLSMYMNESLGVSNWNTVKSTLTDYKIIKHLQQEYTIGVFSGSKLSKFICFDVDSPSITNSKMIVSLLKFTLNDIFHIPSEHIHISFSGKKGYHLEIFFNQTLTLDLLFEFYNVVLTSMKETFAFDGEIEFRPTYKQGVKLPLSTHRQTNSFCGFVHNETLEPLESYEYFLAIEPMDVEYFRVKVLDSAVFDTHRTNYFTMYNRDAEKTEYLFERVTPHTKNQLEHDLDMGEVMSENRLLRNNSRHNTTVKLAAFLKSQGYESEEAKKIIESVLDNTWHNYRHFIDRHTTYDYMMAEVVRLLNIVYRNNYQSKEKEYRLYKHELLQILTLPNKTMRTLMFSLYIQSKKYAKKNGEFYMAYSVIADMGNAINPSQTLPRLKELENLGFIQIVQRNKTNNTLTIEANKNNVGKPKRISEANIYKVTLENYNVNSSPFLTVSLNNAVSIYDAAKELLLETEVKEKLPKNQFYTEYKPIYQKI